VYRLGSGSSSKGYSTYMAYGCPAKWSFAKHVGDGEVVNSYVSWGRGFGWFRVIVQYPRRTNNPDWTIYRLYIRIGVRPLRFIFRPGIFDWRCYEKGLYSRVV
jgi:hypothetical protein